MKSSGGWAGSIFYSGMEIVGSAVAISGTSSGGEASSIFTSIMHLVGSSTSISKLLAM